jgi:hypothetical protein
MGDVAGRSIAEQLAELFLVIGDAMFFDEANEVGGSIAGERRLGEVGIGRKKIFGVVWRLVKLQRPPPEIRIFLPIRSARSSTRRRGVRACRLRWHTSGRQRLLRE